MSFWNMIYFFNLKKHFLTEKTRLDVYSSGGLGPFWIGLHKIGDEWFWPNGSMAVYTNWRPGQPDGCCGADVTCALADYDNYAGMWDDSGCFLSNFADQSFGFVCEKPL